MEEEKILDVVIDEKYAFCVKLKLSEAITFARMKLKEFHGKRAEIFFAEEYDLLFEVLAN